MPKRKDYFDEEAQVVPMAEVEKPKQYYTPAMWKETVQVFKCETCGHFENVEDEMIVHVLKHIPADEAEEVMNLLLKEKNNNG